MYFSLGEAVAAIGLIFAVYQLTKTSWEIVLRIRPAWQRQMLFYLSIAGLIFVLLSTVITQIPLDWLPPWHPHPIFFETLGFLAFIAAPLSYFYFATTRRGLFTIRRAENFYQALLGETARATPDRIEAIINIIAANLDDICSALRYKRQWYPRGTEVLALTEKEIAADFASALFDVILGDSKVANYLVTARLDVLVHIFEMIKKHHLARGVFDVGISKINRCLFENPQSHLYQHLERSGLSLSASVYKTYFGDIDFVNAMQPFKDWNGAALHSKEKDSYALTVYLEALETACEAYFANKETAHARSSLVEGFRQLDRYMEGLWYRTTFKELSDSNRLQELEFFFSQKFPWWFRHAVEKGQVAQSELDAAGTDRLNTSVMAAFAHSVYQYIELLAGLSVEEKDEDIMRLYAMEAMQHLIGFQTTKGDMMEATRTKFLSELWKTIEVNGRSGHYPTVLRVYIQVVGFFVADGESIANVERKRVTKFLEEVVRPRILAGETMANKASIEEELLPSNVTLNRITRKFEYETGGGVQILEP